MAIFRKIHVTFWSDTFTSELNNERKLFYLYLLTNERTKQCGIYEISKRQIAFDLGCSIDTVSILIKYFIKIGKIQYSDSTNEIAIKNWKKFNYSTSPKVVKCIDKEIKLVKNKVLIEYINSIDTLSQQEQEQEQEEEEEEEEGINTPLAFSFYNSLIDYGFNKDLVSEWLKVRKTKKLTNTKTAFNNFIKEVEKTKQDKNKIIEECVIKSWGGFKAEWFNKEVTQLSLPKRRIS